MIWKAMSTRILHRHAKLSALTNRWLCSRAHTFTSQRESLETKISCAYTNSFRPETIRPEDKSIDEMGDVHRRHNNHWTNNISPLLIEMNGKPCSCPFTKFPTSRQCNFWIYSRRWGHHHRHRHHQWTLLLFKIINEVHNCRTNMCYGFTFFSPLWCCQWRRKALITITHSKEAPEANGINWIFKMCLMCPFHAWILTVNSIISEMRTVDGRPPRPIQSYNTK